MCGLTGTGKSRLLRALDAAGAQVLDLEALAAHRGSVLGNMPDEPQPTQKMFDSLVWHELRRFDAQRPVFVESESKKIGRLRVPEALIDAMWASECVVLDAPLAVRVELLKAEYSHYLSQPELLGSQLECLTALHGKETIERWQRDGARRRMGRARRGAARAPLRSCVHALDAETLPCARARPALRAARRKRCRVSSTRRRRRRKHRSAKRLRHRCERPCTPRLSFNILEAMLDQPAPELELPATGGKTFRLADAKEPDRSSSTSIPRTTRPAAPPKASSFAISTPNSRSTAATSTASRATA